MNGYSLILPDGKSLADLFQQATYVHHQDSANATWPVVHNLNKFPSVTIVDSSGVGVCAKVQYVSAQAVVIEFNAACTGKAYLN